MPILIDPDRMRFAASGDGWSEQTMADAASTGADAMAARRWTLDPGAQGPERTHRDVDQLLYVMRGGGRAVVDGADFPLDHESILWLEPGERYYFVAGPDGLEILQAYAPGD